MQSFIDTAKALADPSRVRIVCALKDRELCVCQIVELLGLAPSTVSKHVSVLRQAGLVESRKDGRWVHYRRPGQGISPLALAALRLCDDHLAAAPGLAADATRLKTILETPIEELCKL